MKIKLDEIIFIILNFFYWVCITSYQTELNLLTYERTRTELMASSISIALIMWFLVYHITIPACNHLYNKIRGKKC